VRALFWPLIVRSAWPQTGTVVEGKTGESAVGVSVRSVGVGSASHCGGLQYRFGCFVASVGSVSVGSASLCVGGHAW
jgi:hypothetical protein